MLVRNFSDHLNNRSYVSRLRGQAVWIMVSAEYFMSLDKFSKMISYAATMKYKLGLQMLTDLLYFSAAMNNVTTDGFYDTGAMKPHCKFQPLEALCKRELDQKRPVLLVNPAPE